MINVSDGTIEAWRAEGENLCQHLFPFETGFQFTKVEKVDSLDDTKSMSLIRDPVPAG